MRINHDCIRDLLLTLEDTLLLDDELNIPELSIEDILLQPTLQQYSKGDVTYSTQLLSEAELIDADIEYADNQMYCILYSGITYQGHEFLEKIRPQGVWLRTKTISNTIGSKSISVMTQIATDIISDLIKSQF